MINKALRKNTNWAFVLLLVLAIPFCWFVELLELMVISEGFETTFFSTVWGASIYILHTALWVFVCGVLYRRVRRRERCTVAIPLLVFASIVFRILLLGYGVYRKGLRWVWVLVPLGSYPLRVTEAAEFIVYMNEMNADSLLHVYAALKDRYSLILTDTALLDDGFEMDCPIIVGKAYGRILYLYEYYGEFVLDVMDESKTKGTHWHPWTQS